MAEVQRRITAVAGKVETSTGFETIFCKLQCLIEPMGAYRKVTLLGTSGGRRFHISWEGGEDLRDGDRVLWQGRKFRLEYDADDRYRSGGVVGPYQTGILHEEAV